MQCPGSVKMSEGVEDSGKRSPYAAEGTLAHSYAEVMIANPDWDNASTIGGAEIPVELPEYV